MNFERSNQWSKELKYLITKSAKKIYQYAREIIKDIDTMLLLPMKQNQSLNYDRLFECVACINRSKWIEERKGVENGKLMEDVKKKMMNHVKEIQVSSRQLMLNVNQPDHVEQAYQILIHFEKMCRLEEIIPDLTNCRKDVNGQIQSEIRAILSAIGNEYLLEKRGVSYQKDIHECLIKLKTYSDNLSLFLQKISFPVKKNSCRKSETRN